MKRKKRIKEGTLPKMPTHDIYLNIRHLEPGVYELKIINHNQLIQSIKFLKK